MHPLRTVSMTTALVILALAGCSSLSLGPATIYSSDPSQSQQQRTEDQIEQGNVTAFIAEHPELDAETKKELRAGTLTPAGAMERLKKNSRQ